MKGLVLIGEGHGEVQGLPILSRRLLQEKDQEHLLYVDKNLIRAHEVSGLLKWDKAKKQINPSEWIRFLGIALKRRDVHGVLTVLDGDMKHFPAGSANRFCAKSVASLMASTAEVTGAGKSYSLAVVIARLEYETWLVAGAESLAGRKLQDGRMALPADTKPPAGEPETYGKGWLERNMPGYRPTRDQGPLSEVVDLETVRKRNVRSFARLEHAIEQLALAAKDGNHICTPISP